MAVPAETPLSETLVQNPTTAKRGTMRLLGPLASAVFLLIAVLALRHFLRDHAIEDIWATATSRPKSAVALAIVLTGLSYVILTGYDALALRYIGKELHYRRIAACSFVGYALSHNVGMSFLTGGSVRYRLYSRYGVSALDATRIILFCNLTFWVGFIALGGVVLTIREIEIPVFSRLPFETTRPLGVACLVTLAVLSAWTAWGRGRPRVRVKGLELRLPTIRTFAGQALVSSADWIVAAAVLHVLLPDGFGSFGNTVSIFLLAQSLAMISNLPGGVGVFESVALYLAGDADPAELIGVILVYRVVYYALPLLVATPLIAMLEWRRRHSHS